MPPAETFESITRALARTGAARACANEADLLDQRARSEPRLHADAVREAARGLRVAARILGLLCASPLTAPFRPLGLRGAVAAGHLALASRHPAHAKLVGAGVAEAAPDHPAGLRLVGQASFAEGRFVDAVRAFRGALAVDPDDPVTRALHAEALWFAGERVAARCALATLRADGGAEELAAGLDQAIRSGALEGAGRPRCA